MALSPSIRDALEKLKAHPSVTNVSAIELPGGDAIAIADFDTNLASTWRAAGASPTGVRPTETVEYYFPLDYPYHAPRPTLRPDFNASLPHINPHRSGDRVPPCVVFGSALEVLHNEGVERLFDQMALWLERAAENKLIDYTQGWEPMRRDRCDDVLESDINNLVDDATFGNVKVYPARIVWSRETGASLGRNRGGARSALNAKELSKLCSGIAQDGDFRIAETLLAVCWPVSEGTAGPRIIDVYQPDTVCSYSDLVRFAEDVGCAQALSRFSANIDTVAKMVGKANALPVYIALAIRRPVPLIGLSTEYELLVYRVDICPPEGLAGAHGEMVSPVLIATPMSAPLLRRTSGIDGSGVPRIQLGLVGCGSLGSKVAIHVARAGYLPALLVDDDRFSPHNAARHALYPSQFGYAESKSRRLASEIAQFSDGRKPDFYEHSVLTLPLAKKPFAAFFLCRDSVLLNTTGSPSVRHFLAGAPFTSRVMEACLLNLGGAGLLTLEGENRNPSTTDLMACAFERLRQFGTLRAPASEHEGVVGVGVGCSSITLPMTDANISLIAAGVGQTALRLYRDGLSEAGVLAVARVSEDKMSVDWQHETVGKTHIASVESDERWAVRVLDEAHRKMSADVASHPHVETGGVIVGRVSMPLREITIVDVLDAPPDSKRTASAFVLGTEGLTERVEAYNESGQDVLWCLGTWHSHLMPAGPSALDIATAKTLEGTIAGAVVLLIHRPNGYSAIVRDGY
ncbi:Mov34/MPN/PAD-1 family protein [Burkholderia pseudomallei]|uniref:Mov34/MPN/PAD-1 family protein n=1 Tax=Burkholderia pseudomallei TaxID=28450 RepID=UPI00030A2B58|nr:Mov34/MPN/PAD-1 family protein [Burkholderia pseudomallei]